ncbi:MAG: hypothetical protein WKG32_21140 [Gemmatimonadaceae bacterium]
MRSSLPGTTVSRLSAAVLVLATLAPAAARAQRAVTLDVLVQNAFVWRGVTATNRPVLQPDAYLTTAAARGEVTLGAWASFEPARYDGADEMMSHASAACTWRPGWAMTYMPAARRS